MLKKISAVAVSSFLPLVALAQYTPTQGVVGLINYVHQLANLILPVLIAVAVVYFIWQVFVFVIADSDEKKSKAKGQMIWGIVGIFVMVSVWGLVAILVNTFGTGNSSVTLPTLP